MIKSWTEKREKSWEEEPYHGGQTDGSFNGPPPALWSLAVEQPSSFKKSVNKIPLPHTDRIVMHNECNGRGKLTCTNCSGVGTNACHCGTGMRDNRPCDDCNGSMRRRYVTIVTGFLNANFNPPLKPFLLQYSPTHYSL